MITLFTIKVKDIITCRKSGNSADSESYVKKFNEDRNRLEMTCSPETFYNSRKEAWEAVEDLPLGYNGSEFTNKYSYSIESVTYKYANHY